MYTVKNVFRLGTRLNMFHASMRSQSKCVPSLNTKTQSEHA